MRSAIVADEDRSSVSARSNGMIGAVKACRVDVSIAVAGATSGRSTVGTGSDATVVARGKLWTALMPGANAASAIGASGRGSEIARATGWTTSAERSGSTVRAANVGVGAECGARARETICSVGNGGLASSL